jgi:8-oxo-dGTP diphosphatase
VTREYPARPIVGVGAVILVAPSEAARLEWPGGLSTTGVVIVKRRFEPLAGQWSLPGGGVETGETLTAAVAREVREETGLTIEVGPIIDVFDRIQLDPQGKVQYHFVLADYLCRPIAGPLRAGSDVEDAAVVEREALARYGLTSKAIEVIAKGFAQHDILAG